ncbi:hypothetical protein FH603_5567 [Spirosoma sp. LMG 31447]|uniref:Uncharacterized protein n=1 Tax=Spirosoma utsteinense TaxID=2585773 RepID=A0ABR6WEQ4_9BACT|nr:hypothetical protein [Spirosoma utsteinense]
MYIGYVSRLLAFFGVQWVSAVVSGFVDESLNIRYLIKQPSEMSYVSLTFTSCLILYFFKFMG